MGYGGILGQKYFLPDNVVKVLEDGTLGTDDGSFSYTPVRMSVGTYQGNNQASRTFTFPFPPSIVFGSSGAPSGINRMWFAFPLVGSSWAISQVGASQQAVSHGICVLSGNNLTITLSEANSSIYGYEYIAFG